MGNELPSRLPLMKTMEDAIAVCQRENHNFYVTAFMIEAWLGEVTCRTVAEYAEKKSASDRRFQQGLARELFDEAFGHAKDAEFHHVFQALARFGQFADSQSRQLGQAYWALSVECPADTWPALVPPFSRQAIQEGVKFMRWFVHRLCEWVEAVIHAQMHCFSHLAPVAFDSDPDKRELAILGVQQRHFPELDEFQKAWWEWHHGEAALRFKDSAKWPMVGRGMVEDQTRHHSYPALDELVIWLWPLVRRHRWTYRDLMMVIRSVAPPLLGYPCGREQDLAAYCANVLGLRKGGKGKSAAHGEPPGADVARALCRRPAVPEDS